MQCTKFQLKLPLVSDTNFASCCISLPFFYGSSCFCAQSAHVSKISYLNFLCALSRHWYLQFGPSLNYWPALRNFLHWDKLRFGTWIPLCTTLVFHIASAFKVRGDLLQINAEPSVVIDSNTFSFFLLFATASTLGRLHMKFPVSLYVLLFYSIHFES